MIIRALCRRGWVFNDALTLSPLMKSHNQGPQVIFFLPFPAASKRNDAVLCIFMENYINFPRYRSEEGLIARSSLGKGEIFQFKFIFNSISSNFHKNSKIQYVVILLSFYICDMKLLMVFLNSKLFWWSVLIHHIYLRLLYYIYNIIYIHI